MRTRLLALVFVVGLAGTGCHLFAPPPAIVTPAGQAAYQADQVVLRLTELSNVVKADTNTATQKGNIKVADAFTIIEWISGDANAKDAAGNPAPTTGVVQIVQTTAGQGWKAAALQTYQTRIKPILQRYPSLAPWVDILDGLLQVV